MLWSEKYMITPSHSISASNQLVIHWFLKYAISWILLGLKQTRYPPDPNWQTHDLQIQWLHACEGNMQFNELFSISNKLHCPNAVIREIHDYAISCILFGLKQTRYPLNLEICDYAISCILLVLKQTRYPPDPNWQTHDLQIQWLHARDANMQFNELFSDSNKLHCPNAVIWEIHDYAISWILLRLKQTRYPPAPIRQTHDPQIQWLHACEETM